MEKEPLAPFQGDDSILSSTVEHDLSSFMDKHGDFKPALELLMDNYEGYPDMIRALVEWGDLYTDGIANLEQAVELVLLEHEQTIIPKLDDNLASTEKSLSVITAVTASDRWNPVVSAMAARNKDSTLHNLLTRETRLSKAGITHDVLSSPEAFVQALCKQIGDLMGGAGPICDSDVVELCKRIATMSTYDECIAITALRVLSILARETPDLVTRGLYRRMAQEIRKEVVSVITSTSISPESVARHYVIRLAVLTESIAVNVSMRTHAVDALLHLLSKERGVKRSYDKEILAIRNLYGAIIGDVGLGGEDDVVETIPELNCSVQEKAVLIKTLCLPEVFEDILKALFSHTHRTNIEGEPDVPKRNCLAMLLAFAGVFIPVDELELPDILLDDEQKDTLRSEVKELSREIDGVAKVCEELKPGSPRFMIKGHRVETLLTAVENPLLAHGILIWAREGLQGGSDARALMVTASRHLAFLEAIATQHQVLRGQVLEVIRKGFMREYSGLDINQQEELRGKFMRSVTGMVKIHMAPQIVNVFLSSWADDVKVDKSHLRHFVSGLLDTISPPYSREFAENVLRLLGNERVSSAVDKDAKVGRLVLAFRDEAAAMGL